MKQTINPFKKVIFLMMTITFLLVSISGYAQTSTIGDFVFNDVNGNGIQESGDNGLSGVSVIITDVNENILQTTVTNQNGFYSFDVSLGDYKLIFPESFSIGSQAYNLTPSNIGLSDELDSDPVPMNNGTGNAMTQIYSINIGENITSVDAGYILDSSMPVVLTNFEVQLINESEVLIQWTTASEMDNRHFIVERSSDEIDFRPIGVIEGSGTTNSINHYSLEDLDPSYSINYYRLKQVDFDGAFEYSKVISINNSSKREFQIYPNPVADKFNIVGIQEGEIVITDNMGKTVMQTDFMDSAIDISALPSGIYFVKVSSKDNVSTKKLIKR